MIRVVGYTKVYEKHLAVDDLSFEVDGGEILGLVGPNGAGKTTTLRALSGILTPSGGELTIDGYDVVRKPIEAKRRLAIIPDDPPLFESLTVWEHLDLTARLYGVRDWEAPATRWLERFELAEQRRKMADQLSRGMRQKVAVACALLHEPSALFLDEPLTGLDPRGIRTLYEALEETAARGAAIVVSSHLLGQIEPLCSKFLILSKGQRIAYGSKDEIRAAVTSREDASLEEIFFEATEGNGHGSASAERLPLPESAAPPELPRPAAATDDVQATPPSAGDPS